MAFASFASFAPDENRLSRRISMFPRIGRGVQGIIAFFPCLTKARLFSKDKIDLACCVCVTSPAMYGFAMESCMEISAI